MNDPKIYGVIAEFKDDGALIMEGPASTRNKAYERMALLRSSPNTIRVSIFKMQYETGHPDLIEKEFI